MVLLTDELRQQLPLIRTIHTVADEGRRMIYARFFTQNTGVSFYVAEGEQRNADYLLWGLLIAPRYKFPLRFQITVSRLTRHDWVGMEPCRRDEQFEPACWDAVERTIPSLRQPL